MKIKITISIFVVTFGILAFWLWPYGDAFTVEYGQVVDEVVKIIDDNPTKEGVDKARSYFNSRESRLKEKMDRGLMPDRESVLANRVDERVREKYGAYSGVISMRMDDLSKRHPNIKEEIDSLRLAVVRIR